MKFVPEFAPGTLLPENLARQALAACGDGVKLFRGCKLVPPERIQVGDYTQIDEGVRVYAGLGVVIGRHVHLAFQSSISGGGECWIGDFAGIGAGARLITGSDLARAAGLTNPTVPPAFRTVRRGRVRIGAHAILFTNSILLPDVEVGEGAVVAAGSLVHHDLAPWGIFAGNPLVQVGRRAREDVLNRARDLERMERMKNERFFA